MNEPVHILATVRKPELLDAALLVFRTLDVGFPGAPVSVWGNHLAQPFCSYVANAATLLHGRFTNLAATSHDEWIEGLIHESLEPFWICDTDVIFQQRVAGIDNGIFAGRFEPSFKETWTRTIHIERLHTALMWINPGPLRAAIREWTSRIPDPWGRTADHPLIRQHFVPVRGGTTLFYDTMAGLWHAGLGTPFSPEQDATFEHLHCATYADVVEVDGLREAHRAIYRDLTLARGMKATQDAFYKRRKVRLKH